MPSLETNHPNCDAARPGPPRSAPLCAPAAQTDGHVQTQRTTAPMTKPTDPTSRRGLSRRQILKATGGNGRAARRGQAEFPRRRLRARRGSGSEGRQARLHRADRCVAAVRRQGKGHLRQIRHARRRSAEAGLMGHHARQPRAGLRGQRHRRRAYPDPDAVSDLVRQGDAEQSADADVHPGAAQSERSVHFGRQGI